MRVRKHRVKHYNKIIKEYFLVDDFIRKLHMEMHTRRFPYSVLNHDYGKFYNNSKSKYKKKVRKSKFKSFYDYNNFDTYPFGNFVMVPVIKYNPNKKSRIKTVYNTYITVDIDDLNSKLGTNYTLDSIKNLDVLKGSLKK